MVNEPLINENSNLSCVNHMIGKTFFSLYNTRQTYRRNFLYSLRSLWFGPKAYKLQEKKMVSSSSQRFSIICIRIERDLEANTKN